MSAGVPKIVIVPRTASGRGVPPTRFGVLVRTTPEGEQIVREGYGQQLNWEWLEEKELLSFQLLCGPNVRSTRVTLDGISAGALDQLLRVIRRVPPPGSPGSQVRGPDVELTPSGLLVIQGAGLVATPEGLGRLDGFLTSGGYPRTEYDYDGQSGKVPAGAHTLGRFADWLLAGAEAGLSMPVRFATGAFAPAPTRDVETETPEGSEDERSTRKVSTDVTARPEDDDAVEVWGRLIPYDEDKRTHLPADDYGTDPEGYQGRARWAPHFLMNLDKLVGKPDPPPEKRDPPPFPPPGGEDLVKGGGGGGGGGKGEEEETDPQEERIRATFAEPGQPPADEFMISVPETDSPTTTGIATGSGTTTDSPVHEGIERLDGAQDDRDDAGLNGTTASAAVEVVNDGRFLKVYKGGRLVEVQRLNGGVLTGSPINVTPGQQPPAECPIGGRRKRERVEVPYVSKSGQNRIKVYVDGVLVEDRLAEGEGGILPPGGLPTGGLL